MLNPDAQVMYTPDEVAARLGVHVKTVRRYMRDGQLPSVQIGKRRRVSAAALRTFLGAADPAPATSPSQADAEATAIVAIDTTRSRADEITQFLLASARSRRGTGQSLRIDAIYDADRARLKLIATGSVGATAIVLSLLDTYLAQGH